jgi:hypothetical protein
MLTRYLFFLLVLCCLGQPVTAATFDIGTVPTWVTLSVPDTAAEPSSQTMNSGVYYLLLDKQIHIAGKQTFHHYALKLLNETGMQNNSALSFSFDPSYERLIIHYIRILRKGQSIPVLRRNSVKMLQREENLESHIYDGTATAQIFLEDVQIGDILDYAYSIQGTNPIFDNQFFHSFYTRLSSPIHYFRQRILCPNNKTLYIKNHKTLIEPELRRVAGTTEYVWEQSDIEPLIPDSELPSWYTPYPWVQLTEFTSWKAVAQWAATLYPLQIPLSPELKKKIDDIRTQYPRQEDQVLAALRFVQDDIRYLGMEFGENSHRPALPSKVYKQRFGDCKDKSLLLTSMLSELGVQAWPALVHSSYRSTVEQWEPSPAAFNHVVVKAVVKGITFWFDPTISQQRGTIGSTFFPPYGKALVIGDSSTALTDIKATAMSIATTKQREIFYIDDLDFSARLEVQTTYSGLEADNARSLFASTSLGEMEKSYLNFYAIDYKGIESVEPLRFTDDNVNNTFTVYEKYRITQLPTQNKETLLAEFFPRTIFDKLRRPSTSIRTMPLGISYPENFTHTMEIHLPQEWPIETYSTSIEDDAFTFSAACAYEQDILTLTYTYKTLKDAVEPEEFTSYLTHMEEARKQLGYQISHNKAFSASNTTINWPIVLVALMFCGITFAGARYLYRYEPKIPTSSLARNIGHMRGINGWLALFGFMLIIRTLGCAYNLTDYTYIFDTTSWSLLTVPGETAYDPAWAPALLITLFFTIMLLGFSLLTLILFLQKRINFPLLIIVFMATHLGVLIIENVLMTQFFEQDFSTADIVRQVIFLCFWTPYFLRSHRVAATFTQRRYSEEPVMPHSLPEVLEKDASTP